MPGKSIPLIRGSQLLPFIKQLERLGKDPVPLLRKCYCPVSADLDDPDCIIPTNRLWQFIEESAHTLNNRNLGWETAMRHGVYGGGHFGYQMEHQKNLEAAIQFYNRAIHQHASVSYARSAEADGYVWFYRATIPTKGSQFFQVEQYALGTLTHVARNYLGPKWRPRRIAIASTPTRAGNLTIAKACEELVVGAAYAAIEVPADRLQEGPTPLPSSLQAPGYPTWPFPLEVPEILAQILRCYFPDYPMTLEEVSAILQIHPRTLNRRIEKHQRSFRDVRNQVLMERAKLKLNETDLPLSRISAYLGYANQSAFSRAFTKAVGVSPLKYRIEHSR
jgi:AraC-like DNA-binding protein